MLRGSQPLSPLLLQPDRGNPGLTTYGSYGALQCEGLMGAASISTHGELGVMTVRSAPLFDGPCGPSKPNVGGSARAGVSSPRTVRSATEGAFIGDSISKARAGRADMECASGRDWFPVGDPDFAMWCLLFGWGEEASPVTYVKKGLAIDVMAPKLRRMRAVWSASARLFDGEIAHVARTNGSTPGWVVVPQVGKGLVSSVSNGAALAPESPVCGWAGGGVATSQIAELRSWDPPVGVTLISQLGAFSGIQEGPSTCVGTVWAECTGPLEGVYLHAGVCLLEGRGEQQCFVSQLLHLMVRFGVGGGDVSAASLEALAAEWISAAQAVCGDQYVTSAPLQNVALEVANVPREGELGNWRNRRGRELGELGGTGA